jgi:hypothetical protein
MPQTETEIMRDIFRFLARFQNPPKDDDPRSVAWWDALTTDQVRLLKKWQGHALMYYMLKGATDYINYLLAEKSKE